MSTLKPAIAPLIAAFALAAPAGPAGAVVVSPGSTVNLTGTTLAAVPGLAGVVLASETVSFSLQAAPGSTELITGRVEQSVLREAGSGTLDFYWRVVEMSSGALGHFRIGDFVSTVYDADYRIDGLGDVAPASITRFTNGLGGATDDYAANFNFWDANFAGTLAAGQSSMFMFLRTDATRYAKTAFFDLASAGTSTMSQSFAAFAPAAVPEPASAALTLAALGLLFARRGSTKKRPAGR